MARASKDAKSAAPETPDRARRLRRESLILLLAPVLLYLLACLVTYSPQDPGWSHAGNITGRVQNFGGSFGAWMADIALYFLGYANYLIILLFGLLLWQAMRGSDRNDDHGFTPAWRLVGAVALVVSGAALAHARMVALSDLPEGSGGILGQLVGGSLLRIFGPLGVNLLLVALFLVAVTLVT